jgi:hypothetical protein
MVAAAVLEREGKPLHEASLLANRTKRESQDHCKARVLQPTHHGYTGLSTTMLSSASPLSQHMRRTPLSVILVINYIKYLVNSIVQTIGKKR